MKGQQFADIKVGEDVNIAGDKTFTGIKKFFCF